MKRSLFKAFSVITILTLMLTAMLMQPAQAAGTVSLTTLGSAYFEDFNTLASSGTANTIVPNGWNFFETGTNANTFYRAGTGSDNSGDTYSFGAVGNSERAFGGLLSGSLTPIIGASFTNNTGSTITELFISYTGEQWRIGTLARAERLDFQYSTSATSLNTGTWTNADALDFTSPVSTGTLGALNGNVPPNRTALSNTITDLSIPNGATFWIRWMDFNATGADDGLSVDDFSLTPNGIVEPTLSLTVNDVSAVEGNSGITAFTFTVSLSSPAGAEGVSLDIATADDTATSPDDFTALALPGLIIPAGSSTYIFDVLVNGETLPESDETFFINITNVVGANVADGQGQGTIVNDDVCGLPYTPIYQIQGNGPVAAVIGTVTTEGMVVGDFQNNASLDNGNLNGFHIQDTLGDGDPATSDGIFIYAPGGMDVSAGDAVRVLGTVSEYNGLTEITASQIWLCSSGNSLAPTVISLPKVSVGAFEAYEGMLVTFPQDLYISEYFNFDRFGEIVLTSRRHLTPTAEFEPGPDAVQAAQDFLLDIITLDDGRSTQNPDPAIHPNGNIFDLNNLFRGGDILQNVTGVMDYSFNLYRIQPTQGADYVPANPRPIQPEDTGGNLTVVSMNTLNYFSTIDYGSGSWICGPAQNMECRGADTPEEFARQRAKIIAAISAMNADVIGLLEIENNIYDEAIQNLVDGLNTVLGAGTYDYIHTGVIGTDAIKVALIYKPASVSLVGNYAILDSSVDPRFIDTKNRPALAQTFMDNATGGIFTVTINHFKSKGSDCNDVGDPDLGDGAGNCNITRTLAAQALVDWLATDPTGSGDSDFLIIGDLNAYDHEDPIDAIKAGPDDILGTADDYTDMVFQFQGEDAYSYVFDGQLGYLDYGLASASLAGQVTGVADWHVNADEPDLIDYDMTFKLPAQDAIYAPDLYRYSDHDPVIIGLAVCDEIAPTFEVVSVSPDTLWPANHKYVDVTATVVVSDNFDPDPTVTLVSVTSSEADNGVSDGNTTNDIVIIDDFHFKLRAERSGANGTGRTYTITYMVTDDCGNSTVQSVTVYVPFSQTKR